MNLNHVVNFTQARNEFIIKIRRMSEIKLYGACSESTFIMFTHAFKKRKKPYEFHTIWCFIFKNRQETRRKPFISALLQVEFS